MTGQILDYSIQTNEGVISGDDGNRYSFTGADWQEPGAPQTGMRVDFQADGTAATGIYSEVRMSGGTTVGSVSAGAPGEKSKVVAGILAIFLGGIGVHKFYLGYTGIGLLHIVGWVVTFFVSCGLGCVAGIFTFGIGGIVVAVFIWMLYWILPIVEGVIYLTRSDEQFHERYVVNRRVFL